jgi:hypothetical protein
MIWFGPEQTLFDENARGLFVEPVFWVITIEPDEISLDICAA